MKIIYHHRTLSEDAQGIHIEEMIRAFRKLGHEVHIVSLVKQGGAEQQGKVSVLGRCKGMIPSFVYECLEIGYTLAATLVLLREIRRFKPDFIYERYALYNAAGVLAAQFAKVPIIEEVNAPLVVEKREHGKLHFPRIAMKFEVGICNAATKVVAVSTPLKKILINQGVAERKIEVIPNGVRREALDEPRLSPETRKELNIPEDATVFGFVGWFRPWHALDELIKLFSKNRLQDKHAALLLVGDGPIRGELENLAMQLGVYGHGVYFTGPVRRSDVNKYIRAMDVALQPDVTPYASPMKIFEYLSLGKPVVAPGYENIQDILTDGFDSWLFRPGNHIDLANILIEIAGNRAKLMDRAENAKRTIQKRNFYWESNAYRTIDLLLDS